MYKNAFSCSSRKLKRIAGFFFSEEDPLLRIDQINRARFSDLFRFLFVRLIISDLFLLYDQRYRIPIYLAALTFVSFN